MKILLVMVLVTVLISTASATPTLDGRDPDNPVSLTIHYTVNPDGITITGDPTGNIPTPIGTPVQGSVWQVQLVTPPDGTDWPGTTETLDPAWLGTPITRETDENGIAYFAPGTLAQGIYLVTETTADSTVATPFLVSLPYLWEDEWIYDVHVFPKHQTQPTIEKEIDSITFSDEHLIINWTISVDIRLGLATIEPIADITPNTYLRVIDTLDSRLTLAPGSVSIFYDTNVTTGEQAQLQSGWVVSEEDNTLFFDILEAGRDEIAATGEVGGFIYITFDTIVHIEDASGLGIIENSAVLEYPNRREYQVGNPASTTLYGLELTKINTGGNRLSGAVFHLYQDHDVTGGTINEDATPIQIRTTNVDGLATFYGLPPGT